VTSSARGHLLERHEEFGFGEVAVAIHVERLLSGFRVQGSGFTAQGPWSRVQCSGFRVQGSGSRVQGSGFRVQCSGFRVQGSGSRVHEEFGFGEVAVAIHVERLLEGRCKATWKGKFKLPWSRACGLNPGYR